MAAWGTLACWGDTHSSPQFSLSWPWPMCSQRVCMILTPPTRQPSNHPPCL